MLMGAGASWSCFVSPKVIVVLRGSTRRGGSGWPAACRARCVGARSSEPTGSPEESNCLEASTALWQPIDLRGGMPSQTPTAAVASPMGANASTIARAKAAAVAVGVLVLPSWATIEAPRALCRGRRLCPKERTRVVSARSRPLPIAGRNGTGGGALQDIITNAAAPETPTRDSIGLRSAVSCACR